MIKYNNSNINDWYYNSSDIIKVYRNNAVCYYKVTTSGDTPTFDVCYAVVEDITQYSDTEFEDVYDKATEKWYKLNNLNQYEEYGVYGEGKNITYYKGKLTIDDEVSSRLPQGYTEVEYIENTGTSYINTVLQIYSSTTDSFEIEAKLIAAKHDSQSYQNVFSCMSEDGEPYQGFTYRYQFSSLVGTSIPNGQNTFTIINNADSTQTVTVISSSSQRTYTHTYPLTLFCGLNNSRNPFRWTNSKFYYFKVKMNDELVRDLVPCKRDSDDKYGMYDIVNDVFYTSPNNVNFVGGEPVIEPTKTYEYEWNGSSWVNLGEVSGSSVVEYIETPTSSPYAGIELLTSPSSQSTPMYYEVDCLVKSNQGDNSILGQKSDRETVSYQFGFQAYNSPYYDYGGRRLSTNWSDIGGLNNRIKVGFGVNSGDSKVVIKNLETSTIVQSTTATPTNVTIPLLCNAKYYTNTSGDNYATSGQVRYYGIKIYDNNVLVGDYIPAKNPSTNEYTFYETISQRYCSKIGSGTIAGAETGTTEYPKYYTDKSDPLNNLTFNTMEDALDYAYNNCVYVGLKAVIDGDRYIFSGDSQSGYEWVYNPSKLPVGYTEVEYIENTGTSYINTNFKPNQDTRIVLTAQCVTSTSYGRYIGAGDYNAVNAIQFDYESGAQGTLHISWGHLNSWTVYSNCVGDYDEHTYDWDKNYFYRDKGKQNQFSATTTYTTFQCIGNLGIFCHINNNGGVPTSQNEFFKGKLYAFKMYDNGTLIRDLVPAKRDSDDKYGMYDIVNDVFYVSPNGNNFIGGGPV